ncbi:MAG: methylenetetrahydrofolate reductase [NAD(P)H] [Lachnospiraceae bacterium]|nr:methylenetetrahydrofolate reductase [NAD(P)H] [Lachnospiraceae bacterium]
MIKNLFETKKPTISFEVFPPKKDDEFEGVYATLDKLSELHPDFISVTYGAGGSRSKKTVEIASYIKNTLGIEALAHMTCVGNKKEDIDKVCEELVAANIDHVLALRGDRPAYMTDEQYESRDFAYANELITYMKSKTDLHIAGACYPEKHFEAMSKRADIANLKNKVATGCDFLITQLFMNNDVFYDFQEKCLANGITIPICAGIMPITSAKQVATTISLSGTSIPKAFSDLVARYGDNPEDMRKAGIDYAIRQILDLKEYGADGIHIYSMNKPKMTAEIMNAIQ